MLRRASASGTATRWGAGTATRWSSRRRTSRPRRITSAPPRTCASWRRFTRAGPDAIRYEVTFDDPTTWARPWTAVVTLTRQDAAIYEFACHEGNAGIMLGILGTARQFGARNAATWESPDAR